MEGIFVSLNEEDFTGWTGRDNDYLGK